MALPPNLRTCVTAKIRMDERTPLTEQHFPKKGTPPRAAHWTTYAKGDSALKHSRGKMNKTESAYAEYLELQKHAGEVAWWMFEGLRFRLADNTNYTPDFAVMMADGSIELRETKGFWAEAAKVRIKVAAAMYPFRFIAVKPVSKKHGGGWQVEEF